MIILHYQAFDSLKKTHEINFEDFIVLNTAVLFMRTKNVFYFTCENLKHVMPYWEQTKIDAILKNLVNEGYLYSNLLFWGREPKLKISMLDKGHEIIDAFQREFKQCYLEFEQKVGDIPGRLALRNI